MEKFNIKNVDYRKLLGTIVGGALFLSCILFFTYAYYNWKSENTSVNLSIVDLSTQCEVGTNVDASNIGPVLDYTEGVKFEFRINNSTNDQSDVPLKLNITSISDNLKVKSFKYAVVEDKTGGTSYNYNEPIATGSFTTGEEGSCNFTTDRKGSCNIAILTIASNTTYSYQFIVYIDGTVYNNPDMQENELVGSLELGNCDTVENRLLSTASPGSYVVYEGNTGCSGEACKGQNANYVDSNNMGWCGDSTLKYNATGWRIAYVMDENVWLVSAGAPECMCTGMDSEMNAGVTGCTNYDETYISNNLDRHKHNLMSVASKYCNSSYVEGGICNDSNTRYLNADGNDGDFDKILSDYPGFGTCVSNSSEACYNDLINIGGTYWGGVHQTRVENYAYSIVGSSYLNSERYVMSRGVRPIIKLASTVYITGGTGTQDDPYTIANK